MAFTIKQPIWYNIIVGIYLVLNMLSLLYFLIFPIVVTDPSFILNSFQVLTIIIIFYVLNIIISWKLLTGRRSIILIILLTCSFIWNTWLYSPINLLELGGKLLVFDLIVLLFSIYIFVIGPRGNN